MGHVPDHFKTQEMFEKAIEKDPRMLRYVLNDPKFLEMCEKVVKNVPWCLEYVPMSLITQKNV